MRNPIRTETDAFHITLASAVLICLALAAGALAGAAVGVALLAWRGRVAARAVEPLLALDSDAVCGLVDVPDPAAGLAVAEAFAPEHLQLVGHEAEVLALHVRCAGCVFVGASSGTAFGDYVAGSNHSLPTGGAARFASALSPRAFRRRMAEVRIGDAGPELARAGAPIARAEGFEHHAASMEIRQNRPPE